MSPPGTRCPSTDRPFPSPRPSRTAGTPTPRCSTCPWRRGPTSRMLPKEPPRCWSPERSPTPATSRPRPPRPSRWPRTWTAPWAPCRPTPRRTVRSS
ncbi:hypothetical protein ACFFX0_29455 [Citricoccus parietis]|uniref:Uncharacterized protein n=1 Tax=Citricoccus parietis TaxID=592307 RepID=A0ABV5G804_9MICC